jgi:hypothetical protein
VVWSKRETSDCERKPLPGIGKRERKVGKWRAPLFLFLWVCLGLPLLFPGGGSLAWPLLLINSGNGARCSRALGNAATTKVLPPEMNLVR